MATVKVKSSSNGANSDGTSMNTGNKLGSRPAVRLYPQYNDSSMMDAILSQSDERPDESGIGQLKVEDAPPDPLPTRPAPPQTTELDIQWRQQRLLDAIARNKVKDVRTAVEDGADINRPDGAVRIASQPESAADKPPV